MAGISDIIEAFLLDSLGDNDSIVISRNSLADHFACAPSQINYVLSTRFNIRRGYLVQSRRGGSGCITLIKLESDDDDYLNEILSSIKDKLSYSECELVVKGLLERGIIAERESRIILSALTDRAVIVSSGTKDSVRSAMLKEMLAQLYN